MNVLINIKKTLLTSLSLIAFSYSQNSLANSNYLSPQLAFKPTIEKNIISIKIAPSYYLYKNRIQVVDVKSGTPLKYTFLTKPIQKKFPQVEQVQTLFVSKADLKVNEPANTTFFLIFQGCSNSGLCYPPQRHQLTIK